MKPKTTERKPKRKQAGGRGGSEFKQDYVRQAGVLGEFGMTDEQLGKVFSVSAMTINNWKKKFPAFALALNEGKEAADNAVTQALFKRACGYSHADTDIRTVSIGDGMSQIVKTPTVKVYPPDATSCIFWLKNRQPQKWRDRQELTGKDGAPIVEKFDPTRYSVEELIQLKAMLEKGKTATA